MRKTKQEIEIDMAQIRGSDNARRVISVVLNALADDMREGERKDVFREIAELVIGVDWNQMPPKGY